MNNINLLDYINLPNTYYTEFSSLNKKTKDSILTLLSLLTTKTKEFKTSDNGYYYSFKQGTEVSIYRDITGKQMSHQLFIKMNWKSDRDADITIKVNDEDMINMDDPEYLSLLRNLYDEIKNSIIEEYIPNEKIFSIIVDLMAEIQ